MARPAPRNAREFFELFAQYTSAGGLAGMMRELDYSKVEPRQIYFALHGRAPERRELAVPPPNFSAQDKYIRTFLSPEFQTNLIPHFLEAFPEKRRLLFIHIPKAAGSELTNRLSSKFPHLNSQAIEPGWLTEDQLCLYLRRAVLGLATSDRLFICGHNSLERYRRWHAIRYGDEVFTALRDPVRAIISQVNYILMRMFAAEATPKPDTLGWRRVFAVKNPEQQPSAAAAIDLAKRILRREDVVPANVACRFLGGAVSTAEAALDRIVCYGVELTDLAHLDQWCHERWGIEREGRSNESKPYIRYEDLSPADKDYIASVTAEDGKLYARVQQRLNQSQASSVKGLELA
jgi:hypothetical protein